MVHGRLEQGCGSGSVAWANIMTPGLDREGKGLPASAIVGSADRSSLELSLLGDIQPHRMWIGVQKGPPAAICAHLAFTAGTSAMRVV